jgi:hypothetical protein
MSRPTVCAPPPKTEPSHAGSGSIAMKLGAAIGATCAAGAISATGSMGSSGMTGSMR